MKAPPKPFSPNERGRLDEAALGLRAQQDGPPVRRAMTGCSRSWSP